MLKLKKPSVSETRHVTKMILTKQNLQFYFFASNNNKFAFSYLLKREKNSDYFKGK